MKREMFWADDSEGTVRYENSVIAMECTPSEARELARKLNGAVGRFFKTERPIQKIEKKIGTMTPEERRLFMLMRYAVMYVLDHEA